MTSIIEVGLVKELKEGIRIKSFNEWNILTSAGEVASLNTQLVRNEYQTFKKTERSTVLNALAGVQYKIVRSVVCKVVLDLYLRFSLSVT